MRLAGFISNFTEAVSQRSNVNIFSHYDFVTLCWTPKSLKLLPLSPFFLIQAQVKLFNYLHFTAGQQKAILADFSCRCTATKQNCAKILSPPHPPRCRVLAGCWPGRMAFCRRLVKFSRLLPQSFCGLSIHM